MDRSDVILIASDHNGSEARRFLRMMLIVDGWKVVDMGPVDDGKVDYIDYARLVANAVSSCKGLRGVLICGTGVGMSIAANRFEGVRASLVHSRDVAVLTREHNNSNVICLGSWKSTPAEMLEIVTDWLSTPFGEGRHVPRVERLSSPNLEKIVLVPGVFDFIHPGHIELFKFARSMGKVVVALNDDRSSQALKGHLVNDFRSRCIVLRQLSLVDEIVPFNGNVADVVTETGAKIVVKGKGDERQIRLDDVVPLDIEVKVLPEILGYSATEAIERTR